MKVDVDTVMFRGFIALVFIAFAVLISLLSVALALEFNPTRGRPLPVVGFVADTVLAPWVGGYSRVQRLSTAEYLRAVSTSLNVTIIVASVLFAVLPFVSYLRLRKLLRKEQPMESLPVGQVGRDDLEIMERHFAAAERVVVVAGDYSWLDDDTPLRSRLRTMAEHEGAVTLTTYRDRNKILERLRGTLDGETLQAFQRCLMEDRSKRDVKCSYIEYRGRERKILFLYDREVPEHRPTGRRKCYIGIIYDQPDTRYLLKTLEVLCRPVQPVPVHDSSPP